MDSAMLIEIYGYIGSALVVISMLMPSIIKLRVVNTVGSIISGSYALLIHSFPLALMNGCLIAINLYNLYKLLKTKQTYDLVEATSIDSYIGYFLNHYKQDIQTYFPGFEATADLDRAYVVCCEGTPAGLLLGKDLGNGTIGMVLDYSTPAYRDCSVGAFAYEQLKAKGVKKLQTIHKVEADHAAYLTKMGFVNENGVFVKNL